MRLENRRAIITGAGSGIGEATTTLFTQEGCRVLAVDVPSSAIATAHAGNEKVIAMPQDITEDGAPQAIVDRAVEAFGGLDIVFNCAGVSSREMCWEVTDEAWDRVLSVNLTAMMRLCRAAIPHLKESAAGRIINVASVMAQGTDFGLSAYCASKAGVAGLTHTLALELGKFGITANYLLPGAIYTGMTRANFDQDYIREVWEKKAALRRLGYPIDMARPVLFLASDDGAFVTGHGLVADGGLTLRI